MNSPSSTRSKPPSADKGGADGKVASGVPNDGKVSQLQPNKSNVGANNGANVTSSAALNTNLPLPPQAGAEQQSDAASATSNGSQVGENRPTRSRTRAHSQPTNTDGKQNGEKRYQEEVSYRQPCYQSVLTSYLGIK